MRLRSRHFDLLVVMDPIASITSEKDSSFAMLLEAQRRGWRIRVAELGDIWIRDGRAWGCLTGLRVTDHPDDWYEAGDKTVRPLDEMDVILMRKDPPFDIAYVYATYILERAENGGALVVNRPAGLRSANEKAFVSQFPECAASTLVSRSLGALNAFIDEHDRAVIKPLDRMAGTSVFITGVGERYGQPQIPAPTYLPAGFANLLRLHHRTAAGYGIREAADIIGIDRGHLSRIERGHRCPSPEVAERIAELYRLPIAVTDSLMAAAAHTREYGRSIGVR